MDGTSLVRLSNGFVSINDCYLESVIQIPAKLNAEPEDLFQRYRDYLIRSRNKTNLVKLAYYERIPKNEKEAILDTLVRIFPSEADAYFQYAKHYRMQGDWQKQIEYTDRAIGIDPGNEFYLIYKAWALFRCGKHEESLTILREGKVTETRSVQFLK